MSDRVVITAIDRGSVIHIAVPKGVPFLNSKDHSWHGGHENDPYAVVILLAEDEGVTWLRGYHKHGSPEADALKTAWSLRRAA